MIDWPEMVRQYGPVVWRTAFRLLGNEADAADCYQETFIAALQVSRREHVAHWAGLMQRLATVRALSQLRQRLTAARRRTTWSDFATTPSPAPGPTQAAQAAELAARLRHEVARLPRREAEVLCLRSLAEFSYQQIADELGLRLNAVGVLLHRARRRLRASLTEPMAGAEDGSREHAERLQSR